jgi:serine/threonine protein kinase
VCPECGEAGDAGACAKDAVARVPAGTDGLLGEQIGSWRIARLIGAGGMGRVYLGVQPKIGARVAIKVLKDANDADVVERFFNEARAVNVIRHEGIVDIIDLGRLPDGAPYIVMELLQGVPLRVLVKRQPRPHAGALAKVLVDVLAALDAAHAHDIIHRDLKPDNIFVSPAGTVTVLDFGIAKLARDVTTQTKTGGLLGTPAYMSAEQARAQPVDARSDLYSVGVILYEATTGVLPFVGPSLYELLDQHVKATPKPPREIDPAIPEELEAVILRALAKDPADRFASAAEMRTALIAALEPLPKAELQLPAIAVARPVPTTAHAATQATSASLVYGETRASEHPSDSLVYGETRASGDHKPGTMQGRGSSPLVDREVRVSRALIAVMAGSALLGLAAVAYVVFAVGAPREREVVADAAAIVVDGPPLDAPVDGMPDATIDAMVDAAIPIDAPAKIATKPPPPKPPPPDLTKGPAPIKIPNMARFDPVAYFKTARETAEWIGGGPARPYKVVWREFDRKGLIDLTTTGSAEYMFAMATPKLEKYCLFLIIIEDGVGRMSIASSSENCRGGIQTPRCTVPQLWEKAIAAGIPDSATHGTANLNGRWWTFSVPGVRESQDVKNDCP